MGFGITSIRLYAMQQGGKGRILLRSALPTCPGPSMAGAFSVDGSDEQMFGADQQVFGRGIATKKRTGACAGMVGPHSRPSNGQARLSALKSTEAKMKTLLKPLAIA